MSQSAAPELGGGEGSKRKAGGVIELPYLDGVQHAAFPVICDLLASASPNQKEHPTMSREWARARELLAKGPTPASKEPSDG
ncbi:MAG: hypothetical protein H0U52_16200 [Chloroflexi bacterium]|nr:hypothetical protein [Chloroflexota bacterium]